MNLFLFLLFFSTSTKAEFLPLASVPNSEQTQYRKAESAVFMMTGENIPVRCTATYISNEGHAVTAFHCLRRCFPRDKMKKWDSKVSKSTLAVSASLNDFPKKCEIKINGKDQEIEILHGPKGWLTEELPISVYETLWQYDALFEVASNFKNTWLNAFQSGWGFGGDFAIFKVKNSRPTDCLKLASSHDHRISKNHYYTLAYPGKMSAQSEEVNTKLVLSTGKIEDDYLYFRKTKLNFKPNQGNYFVTDIIVFGGSSGGAIIDYEKNQIRGVLSIGALHKEKKSTTGRFISANRIYRLSNAFADSISCDDNK
jgi:hypothetical protein